VFQLLRIEVGRCGEVRDHRNRLVRTNHVVFADTEPALNHTVSRRHAHLDYHAGEGAYRVYDDGSEQGTSVTRAGRTIAVPPGPRGVRLQPGDEIVLGLARLRVKTTARV
jgi:pSer/pThr/pTyr-binding forkhead associated (FHA) protein